MGLSDFMSSGCKSGEPGCPVLGETGEIPLGVSDPDFDSGFGPPSESAAAEPLPGALAPSN